MLAFCPYFHGTHGPSGGFHPHKVPLQPPADASISNPQSPNPHFSLLILAHPPCGSAALVLYCGASDASPGGSSNGRTADSGSACRGSSPRPPAINSLFPIRAIPRISRTCPRSFLRITRALPILGDAQGWPPVPGSRRRRDQPAADDMKARIDIPRFHGIMPP